MYSLLSIQFLLMLLLNHLILGIQMTEYLIQEEVSELWFCGQNEVFTGIFALAFQIWLGESLTFWKQIEPPKLSLPLLQDYSKMLGKYWHWNMYLVIIVQFKKTKGLPLKVYIIVSVWLWNFTLMVGSKREYFWSNINILKGYHWEYNEWVTVWNKCFKTVILNWKNNQNYLDYSWKLTLKVRFWHLWFIVFTKYNM